MSLMLDVDAEVFSFEDKAASTTDRPTNRPETD